MNTTAIFRVEKKQFLDALNQLKKIEKSGKKKESTLEVTILNGYIQLVIPGIQLYIHASTSGSAKFTIRLWYITDVVNAEKDNELNFTLNENQLKLRGFSFGVLATFFENDRILRSIDLPVNYKYLDVVRLYLSERYTTDEIIFNNLDKEVVAAINKLKTDIDKVSSTLRQYGFSREEVETLILNKLKQ